MNNLNNDKAILIAEIGGNHEGSLSKAIDLMYEANENGADIIKFQSYSGEGLVNKKLNKERYDHFNRFMLSDDQWHLLAEAASKKNINFSSSVWDIHYFQLLDKYISVYKVGSGDLNNFKMIESIVKTKKSIILSTAMSDLSMIKKIYNFVIGLDSQIVKEGRLGILQCSAIYDNPIHNLMNISVMKTFKKEFKCKVGFSNHAMGINPSLAAIANGADILEFHYTDNKEKEFRDHKLSFDKTDLKFVSKFNNEIREIMGSSKKSILEDEASNEKEFRRGVFLNKNLKKGDIVNLSDLVFLRPEAGISYWDYNKIIGKCLKKDIAEYEPLSFDDFNI